MDAPFIEGPPGVSGLGVAEHFVSESGLNKSNFAQISGNCIFVTNVD
jgi:hypothetical protein